VRCVRESDYVPLKRELKSVHSQTVAQSGVKPHPDEERTEGCKRGTALARRFYGNQFR